MGGDGGGEGSGGGGGGGGNFEFGVDPEMDPELAAVRAHPLPVALFHPPPIS